MTVSLVILGILTGAIVALVVARVTRWYEVLLLGGWGVLAAVSVYSGELNRFFASLGTAVGIG